MSPPAGFDTDRDGMPDAWEAAHGLNPAVADNNGDFDGDGYTNLRSTSTRSPNGRRPPR